MSKKNVDLSVFGHVNVDEYIKVPNIPSFGSINITGRNTYLGGTAANIAKVSAMLGLSVQIYSIVSSSFPVEYIRYLYDLGIDTKNLVIDNHISHGPSCYIVSDGEKQVAYIDQGPMETMENFNIKSKPAGTWIHFATGKPEFYIKIMQEYDLEKSKILFDPGQELTYRYDKKSFLKLFRSAEITVMNEKEFEFARKMVSINTLKNAKNVIITRGARGCEYFTKSITIEQENVYSGDTTGSGDAFRAGLYYALKNNHDLIESCKIANKVAGIVIKHGIYNINSEDLLSEL
ncbi:MAG: PfkB family carbohydrate kinase [Thermoplasmata archaeon]